MGSRQGKDRERIARAAAQSVHVSTGFYPASAWNALEDALVSSDVCRAQSALPAAQANSTDARDDGGEFGQGDDRSGD